jgi:hypothetical protein
MHVQARRKKAIDDCYTGFSLMRRNVALRLLYDLLTIAYYHGNERLLAAFPQSASRNREKDRRRSAQRTAVLRDSLITVDVFAARRFAIDRRCLSVSVSFTIRKSFTFCDEDFAVQFPSVFTSSFVAMTDSLDLQDSNNPVEATASSTYREFPRWDVCTNQPCRHLLCYDVDWLENVQDYRRNPDLHFELWMAYYNLSYRNTLPAGKLAGFEPKFERCQRIDVKAPELETEKQYRQGLLQVREAWHTDDETLQYAEEMEALERNLGKTFPWYLRESTS